MCLLLKAPAEDQLPDASIVPLQHVLVPSTRSVSLAVKSLAAGHRTETRNPWIHAAMTAAAGGPIDKREGVIAVLAIMTDLYDSSLPAVSVFKLPATASKTYRKRQLHCQAQCVIQVFLGLTLPVVRWATCLPKIPSASVTPTKLF